MRVTLICNPTAGDESLSASDLVALLERPWLDEIDDEYDIDCDDPDQKLHSDIKALEALVAEYPPSNVAVTIDGQSFAGQYVLIEAMNIKSVGPNLQLAPEADPGDGYLDFV